MTPISWGQPYGASKDTHRTYRRRHISPCQLIQVNAIRSKGSWMKNKIFHTMLGVMSALALIQTAPSYADAADQAAPAGAARDQEVGLADVIVTARRVEERLQDVPISISVFNQQQLNNLNITNSQDLALYTPSLSVNN